ncbi:MAG: hypothetical protein AAB570_00945 [Patescibacteria group bacterium]
MKNESSAAREAAAHQQVERLTEAEQRAAMEKARRSMELPAVDDGLDAWSGDGRQREFTFKDPRQLELFGLPEGASASEVEPGVARVEGQHDGKDVTMELPADLMERAQRSVALFDVAEAAVKTYFNEGDPRDMAARHALEMLVRYVASKEENPKKGKDYVMEAAMKMGHMDSVSEILGFAQDVAIKGWVEHNVRPGETGELNQSLLELGYEREDVNDFGDEIGGDIDEFLQAEARPARLAGLKRLFGAGMEIAKQLKSESVELIASAGKKAYLKGMEAAGSLVALVADAALGKHMEKSLQFDLNLGLYGTESKESDLEAMEAELLAAIEGEEPSAQEMAEMELEAAEMGPEPSDAEMEEMKATRRRLETEEPRATKDEEVVRGRPGLGSRRTSQPAGLGIDIGARFDTFMKDIDNLDIVKGHPELMDLLKMKPDDRLQDQAIVENTGLFGRLGRKYRDAKKRAAEFDRLMSVYESQTAVGHGGRSPLGIREMPSGEILSDFGAGGMPQERRGPNIRGMEFPEATVSPERAAEFYKGLQELKAFIRNDVQEHPQFYGSDVGKDLLGILAMTGQEAVSARSKGEKTKLEEQKNVLVIAQRRREMVENPEKFAGIKDKFEKMQSYINNELDLHPDGPFAGELAEANNLLDISADEYLIAQADERKQADVKNFNRIIQRVQKHMAGAIEVPEAEGLEAAEEEREAA